MANEFDVGGPNSISDIDQLFAETKINFISKFHFEIVRGCQLRCVGCPNSTLQPKVEKVTPDDFNRYLQNVDVQAVGYLRLFNFGEPLLHHNLAEILTQIPKQQWSAGAVEISTNAQFCDWPSFEEAIKTRVLTQLVTSCDGNGTAEDYERLRPPSRWEKLVEFLEKARELRDRYHPELSLITRTICVDPEDKQRWIDVLGPRGWQPEFRGWQHLPQSEWNMVGLPPTVPERICSFQKLPDRLYVDWDGTVVPCCVHPRAGIFGNLGEQTYNEIMVGQRRVEMLQELHSNRLGLPICNACEC